jgi:hypothetical protein
MLHDRREGQDLRARSFGVRAAQANTDGSAELDVSSGDDAGSPRIDVTGSLAREGGERKPCGGTQRP